MNILLIVDPINEKRPAGLGRSVYQFALALMQARPQDTFTIVTRNVLSESVRFSGVSATVVYETTGGVPVWRARIGKLARTADCVISFTPLVPVTLRHSHIVVFAHDFAYISFGTFFHAWTLRFLHNLTFLKAKTICAVSAETAEDVRRYFWVPIRTSILVIYNGFDHFSKVTTTTVSKSEPPFFLSVGVLKERKNTLMTVQAFAAFSKMVPGYRLFIVGNYHTAYGEYIHTYIDREGLSTAVVMKDFVSDVELAELYQQATALVFPSLVEGFGFPVLEAMAYHTPVITSKHGALAEVAGDAALLIDPRSATDVASAMVQVLDLEVRVRLIESGSMRAKKFTWAQAGQALSVVVSD
jgi:glycosyltransferase involved in cell wall biosynthesis